MATLGFLLDWKSIKKTSRPNYSSPLKNKLIPLATHHRHDTYLCCGHRFSGYIQIQGFCVLVSMIYSISEELFEEYCNQDQPHECYYYISTHLNGFSQSGFINKPSVNVLTFFARPATQSMWPYQWKCFGPGLLLQSTRDKEWNESNGQLRNLFAILLNGQSYKGPLIMVQRSFMQSGPKVLHPVIFMLLLLKHCYLLT